MVWVPLLVATAFFAGAVALWFVDATRIYAARASIPRRVIVVGSRGKSGTVRLIDAALQNNGIPTYSKITGTVAQEITVANEVVNTVRLGPVSASEMADTLLRARRQQAQAIVFECMAVNPKLIAYVQNQIIQATVVVMPTIRLDHLEDEGDTIAGITRNILQGLREAEILVTGEENEDALKVIQHWAHQHNVVVLQAVPSDATPQIPGHHPTNIETACVVAEHFGVKREAAIVAMRSATTEPDAEIGWSLDHDGAQLRFSDLGGANDPQSAFEAVTRAQVIAADETVVPIIVSRWDRPLRALAFAYALRANPNTPRVGVIGSASPQIHLALRRQGFRRDQIQHLGFWSTVSAQTSIRSLNRLRGGDKNAWFVMLENIHAWPADRLRSAVHRVGQPINVGRTRGEAANND